MSWREPARRQLVHALQHQLGAHPAGRAEAAALVGKELREVVRHLEHVARRSKTMKAPAVGTSSKPMRRPNSSADRHTPGRPAHLHRLGVARAAVFQHAARCGCPGVFVQPGRSQSPDTEWILVPVDCAVPMPAHQAPPCRAICAAAQKVSTLLTMVGWPR
jgi:hypothetical protein